MVAFFSFENQLYFWRVLSKIRKTFVYNLFDDLKHVYFLSDQMPKMLTLSIHNEYTPLFLLLKTFLDYLHIHLFFFLLKKLLKIQRFRNWIPNCNLYLYFSDIAKFADFRWKNANVSRNQGMCHVIHVFLGSVLGQV